jgi:hypothetical protein
MDVPTSWSRSIVETLRRRRHASHSKSWRWQTLCDDGRIAHEEKQFCVEASTVIDGRSQEGREGRRRGCEPTDQRAVAEKVSALRTGEYFAEQAAKGDIEKALRMLKRSGKGNAPVPGDELPQKATRRRR